MILCGCLSHVMMSKNMLQSTIAPSIIKTQMNKVRCNKSSVFAVATFVVNVATAVVSAASDAEFEADVVNVVATLVPEVVRFANTTPSTCARFIPYVPVMSPSELVQRSELLQAALVNWNKAINANKTVTTLGGIIVCVEVR
jgi:hypothetical protein